MTWIPIDREIETAYPSKDAKRISLIWIYRKQAEYGFGEHGFKHRAQWVFRGSLSSGERSQWVPFNLLSVCQSELTEFLAELTELAAELSEFSLPKQYSRNSIPPVPYERSMTFCHDLSTATNETTWRWWDLTYSQPRFFDLSHEGPRFTRAWVPISTCFLFFRVRLKPLIFSNFYDFSQRETKEGGNLRGGENIP